MSNVKEAFQKGMEIEKLKAETDTYKAKVQNEQWRERFNKLEIAKEEVKKIEASDIGSKSQSEVPRLLRAVDDYFTAAKKKTTFLVPEFDEILSLRPRQLTTFAASTGSGKSTLTANLAKSILSQKGEDGKHKSVLVITNEELAFDVYLRVCCLMNGWNYADHANLSPQHISKFQQFIHGITKTGLLQVIDDGHGGVSGNTSTIEGFRSIFQRLADQKIKYDLIIIDYFQNISMSKMNPSDPHWKIQADAARFLDQMKNVLIETPIVVLAQVHKPNGKETKKDYVDSRMIGAKNLKQVSSEFIEMFPDFETKSTEWYVHKSRVQGSQGKSIFTGFSRGSIVSLTKSQLEGKKLLLELGNPPQVKEVRNV